MNIIKYILDRAIETAEKMFFRLFLDTEPVGDVYRATWHEFVWYLPTPNYQQALWCKRFLEKHERFLDIHQSGDTIIEVGAATGEYTVEAADRIGATGTLHTFEAEPLNYECLCRNIDEMGIENVRPIHAVASSSADTTIKFGVDDSTIANHAIHRTREDDLIPVDKSDYRIESAVTTTVDDYTAEQDIDTVDILKVTVNEHEYDVLKGAVDTLKRTQYVILNVPYDDATELLEDQGFTEVERRDHDALGTPVLYEQDTLAS